MTNKQVAEAWAKGDVTKQDSNGHLFFTGPVLYSYGLEIAVRVKVRGKTVFLIRKRQVSVTTSSHINLAIRAIPPGSPIFVSKHIHIGKPSNTKTNVLLSLRKMQREVAWLLEEYGPSKQYQKEAKQIIALAEQLRLTFGLPKKTAVVLSTSQDMSRFEDCILDVWRKSKEEWALGWDWPGAVLRVAKAVAPYGKPKEYYVESNKANVVPWKEAYLAYCALLPYRTDGKVFGSDDPPLRCYYHKVREVHPTKGVHIGCTWFSWKEISIVVKQLEKLQAKELDKG